MGIRRQRSIPPEVWTDETLSALPAAVRLTANGLRMHADDSGVENANVRLLWASLYPLSTEVSEGDLSEHLLLLAYAGEIVLYTAGERTYYALVDWPKVDHPQPSRLPQPPPDLVASVSRTVREGFAAGGEGESGERVAPGESPSRTDRDGTRSPFCPKHPEGTFNACGPCGTARVQHETDVARLRRAAEEESR
jgi:hypothetical protein